MDTERMEIDLVYLWVDGDDPVWQQKKNRYVKTSYDNSETNCKGRYISNDELRYSLRAVEKYIPWVRKIFIVTDAQQPAWLDVSHPKINLVDHTDIMPAELLPTFNSSVIEYFLHRIPGLASRFLYSNDDMFVNEAVSPEFFFASDGYPIVRLKRNHLGKWYYRLKELKPKGLGQYARMVFEAGNLVEDMFGVYYPGVPHHNVDSYLTADYEKSMEVVFADQVKSSLSSRTREVGNLGRAAISFYALSQGRAHLQYVGRKTSSRILLHRHQFHQYMDTYQPTLFCLNDSQRMKDEDRAQIGSLLESLHPDKSSFEL